MADETKSPADDPSSPKISGVWALVPILAPLLAGLGAWVTGLNQVQTICLTVIVCVGILAWTIVQATTSHGAAKIQAARVSPPAAIVLPEAAPPSTTAGGQPLIGGGR